LIVVEGPDGAGKTTLVQQLASDLRLLEGSRSTANRDEIWKYTREDTYTALGDAVKGHAPVRIWDRMFFSELVYHKIMDRPCQFRGAEQMFIREVLHVMRCPVIVCFPPREEVAKNVGQSHQLSVVPGNLDFIAFVYQETFNSNDNPDPVWYDYTGHYDYLDSYHDYTTILRKCKHYLELRRGRAW
jgi:ABC-type cobalamin/Fe3+-siderophores transport system ATPase subunit